MGNFSASLNVEMVTLLFIFSSLRPIHLYLIFEKSSLKNQVRRTVVFRDGDNFCKAFAKVSSYVSDAIQDFLIAK